MTNKLKCVLSLIISILINISISAQCPSGNNKFLGTTNSDWSTATNWSEGCVPTSPITGFISIEANCTLSGTASYTFNTGSTFQIKAGVTFTNTSSGTWTMNGTTSGDGTHVDNLTLSGPIKPGYVAPPFSCSGAISHGGQNYTINNMPDGKCWITENLNIGTMITGTTNMTNNSTIEKYCYGNNAANCNTYGGLYQWNEMMQYTTTQGTQGICPTGWHLPTDAEWTALETALPSSDKGSRLAGNAGSWTNGLLEQSTQFGTSGFKSLPAGGRLTDGTFGTLNDQAYFWSSTQYDPNWAYYRELYYDSKEIGFNAESKSLGLSVRCVKD